MRAALLGLAFAACYSPAERDCTVTCTAAKDCIGGQVCGTDHLCSAPAVAGHCSPVDAPPATHDASPTDASAGVYVTLTVDVMGNGKVDVQGVASCTSMMCSFQVLAGVPVMLTASQTKPDKMFQMWMEACSGSQPTCALTPTMPVKVGAKFE